ncbi:hypothetical protein D7030_13460 [Flavobacteriaceae bacterium AU392]|nr:hypothetical protein D1817_05030 [Flavobacteriaceae bacterium]RKM81309.1 hypothetical protein D7030_13460 [Flavobacteriaceae bacterium AU392]
MCIVHSTLWDATTPYTERYQQLNFKMIDWLNNKYDIALETDQLKEIQNFTLLWNIFENLIFETRFSVNQIEDKLADINLDQEIISETFDYCKNRYINNNETNERFEYLYLRNNDNPDLVRETLISDNPTDLNKVKVVVTIVSRFRNNLFHGIKDFKKLHLQKENFEMSNKLLQSILNSNNYT